MIFYGKGVVWDAAKHKRLCAFTNGAYETERQDEIEKLKALGYDYEGTEPVSKPEKRTKAVLVEEAAALGVAAKPELKKWRVKELEEAIDGAK